MSNYTPKEKMSFAAIGAAIGFGIAGTWIDPAGIIDKTMLYLIAQLLIFAATIMGFGEAISKMADLINSIKKQKE